MSIDSKTTVLGMDMIHWARLVMAILVMLVAATHLSAIIPSNTGSPAPSPQTTHTSNQITSNTFTNTARTSSSSSGLFGFAALSLWLDIEIIAYTIIAVVYLLGLRSWYVPSVLFNAFNVVLYFLSGIIAIPGISGMAFGGRLNGFPHSLSSAVLIISWVAALILGIALLKYDQGSELDKLSRAHAKK
jgi:hypothetical protein